MVELRPSFFGRRHIVSEGHEHADAEQSPKRYEEKACYYFKCRI